VEVGGSLGGVQVVSLCEGAGVHSRVLAAGAAASASATASTVHQHDKALFFSISRKLQQDPDQPGITHTPNTQL
jgi:hypothetical protein